MVKNVEERRATPRVQVSLHLHLVYNDLDQLVEHYSKDISEGGVFVETNEPFPVGSRVKLEISLVHQDLIYVKTLGEVVHIIRKKSRKFQPGMGVRFVEISPEGQQFIKDFVLSRLTEEPKKTAKKQPKNKKATGKKKKK